MVVAWSPRVGVDVKHSSVYLPVSWPAGNSANSLCKGFVDEHATIDKSGIGRIHAACEIGFKIVVEEIDAPLPHNPFVLDQLVAFTQLCRRECAWE